MTISALNALDLAVLALRAHTQPANVLSSHDRYRLSTEACEAISTIVRLRDCASETETPARVPTQDTIYDAYDRWVCLRSICAGTTASCTGTTIGGYRLTPLTLTDAAAWRAGTGMQHLSCECGRLRAHIEDNAVRITSADQ